MYGKRTDAKLLDTAKINLAASINALRKFADLVRSLNNTSQFYEARDYREADNCLGVNDLVVFFKPFEGGPRSVSWSKRECISPPGQAADPGRLCALLQTVVIPESYRKIYTKAANRSFGDIEQRWCRPPSRTWADGKALRRQTWIRDGHVQGVTSN